MTRSRLIVFAAVLVCGLAHNGADDDDNRLSVNMVGHRQPATIDQSLDIRPQHQQLTSGNIQRISTISGPNNIQSIGEVSGVQLGLAPQASGVQHGLLGEMTVAPQNGATIHVSEVKDESSILDVGKEIAAHSNKAKTIVVNEGLATGDASIAIVPHPNSHPELVVLRSWIDVKSSEACQDRCDADNDCIVSDYGKDTSGTLNTQNYVAEDQTCILYSKRNPVI